MHNLKLNDTYLKGKLKFDYNSVSHQPGVKELDERERSACASQTLETKHCCNAGAKEFGRENQMGGRPTPSLLADDSQNYNQTSTSLSGKYRLILNSISSSAYVVT